MKTKRCNKCGEVKPITEFYKNRTRKDGLYSNCKECASKYQKEYRKKYPEMRRRYERENRKRISEKAREKRLKNPHKYWVSSTLRKHRYKGFKVNISRDELIEIAKNTTNCYFCDCKLEWGYGKGASKNSPTLDRINNEGVLTLKNTQILFRRCNGIKQEKSMQEFIEYCTIISNKFKKNKGSPRRRDPKRK